MLPSTATAALNQGLVEDTQLSFYFQPSPLPHFNCFPQDGFHPSLPNFRVGVSDQSGSSLEQRSSTIPWSWAEYGNAGNIGNSVDDHEIIKKSSRSCLSAAAIRMKKVKARRKMREPRFCFKTLSEVDVLDDGYKWRKYGQKVVKNTQHPRSYYRCVRDNCRVKKRVERLAEDPRMVITTYEGRHAHSPPRDEDEPEASSHTTLFW
uniref:Transcription factor WRKY5 n=1 Tax=Lilium regale TaxID=82328 RepID=A0A894TFU8_LILRE|nr:transcription factor WRKY5 [Lilium regale]